MYRTACTHPYIYAYLLLDMYIYVHAKMSKSFQSVCKCKLLFVSS